MPRMRKKIAAYAMAGLFIVILIMELLAIFSPAFAGRRANGYDVLVVAPGAYSQEAEKIARAVADALRGGYGVRTLDNINASVVAIVVYHGQRPVLLLFATPELASSKELDNYASAVARYVHQVEPQLGGNATLVVLGPNQTFTVPSNTTIVSRVILQVFALASLPANATATASGTNSTSTGG